MYQHPESIMHELEEEEREYALRYHSEKLAIAFGILKTSPGMAIRIVKNLRMLLRVNQDWLPNTDLYLNAKEIEDIQVHHLHKGFMLQP
ncbi:hypothetical protein F0562_014111 [Nyssa sinensis]|uniref:DYW domain-containing protein n=1 Tax=Nyssa sinensis TaxID=561372 RepID=A0A5J4ZP96_9ASTE|nr:hypothetical protein F0562_014111 [Nyssa sinensis]